MPKFHYIQSSSIVLQRPTQEILVCKRSKNVSVFPNAFVFPGGKLEENISNWSGEENVAKNTALQELFEEAGIILGNKTTIPSEEREGSWQSKIQNNKTTQKLLQKVVFAGRRQTPPFGKTCYDTAYFYFSDNSLQTLKGAPDGKEITEIEWVKIEKVISMFLSRRGIIPPPILYICKLLKASPEHWITTSREQTTYPPGLQTPIEFVKNFQAIPLFSNTVPPYFTTNLGILHGKNKVLYIDPGWNNTASQAEKILLKHKTNEKYVFLTHHHTDHTAGLSKIEALFPDATIYAHPFTIERVNTTLETIKTSGTMVSLGGDWEVELIHAPGHTKGHMVLFDRRSRTIYAGDHVTGAGPVLLDAHSGNMKDYFSTLEKLEKLKSTLLIPSHGKPNYMPSKLLNYTRAHRKKRETQILKAVQSGKTTITELLEVVYENVPKTLWKYAKLNIHHHLAKLADERRIHYSNQGILVNLE